MCAKQLLVNKTSKHFQLIWKKHGSTGLLFLEIIYFWTCDLRTWQVCTHRILYVRFWCTNLNIRVYQILTNGKPDWHSTCWCYVWAYRFQPIFLYALNCLGELITSYTYTFVWREGLINNKLFILQPSIILIGNLIQVSVTVQV